MRVVGLITEYNPFHNGHLYHLQEAKKLAKADYVIAVMSGNFLQRGEPALINKWARAEMAISNGVDLVLEIPAAFATRSAPSFAFGSVKLLEATGVVTHLCFGSEEGNLEPLLELTQLLHNEPPELSNLIKEKLGLGIIYPLAQSLALKEYLQLNPDTKGTEKIATSPNNILGIEYLKALATIKSSIEPVTIKRIKNEYHDQDLPTNHCIASATSIRQHLLTKGLAELDGLIHYLPKASYDILQREIFKGCAPVFSKSLEEIIFYALRVNNVSLKSIVDVTEGLENRIIEVAQSTTELGVLIEGIKNKRYTWTRLQRIMIHYLLGFTQSEADLFQLAGPQYLRVLAFTGQGQQLLSRMKKQAQLPIITRVAPFMQKQGLLKAMLELDIKATNLYTLSYPLQRKRVAGLDFLQGPIF